MRLTEDQLLLIQGLVDEFHFLAADVTEHMGACFLRNDQTPSRHDGNQVRRIRLHDQVTVRDFFEEVERFYSYQDYLSVRLDPWTRPLGIEAQLLQDGHQLGMTEIVMATDGPIGGTPGKADIVRLEGDAGWEALGALMAADAGNNDGGVETFKLARRRGEAFTWYLAMNEGRAIGHFSERTRDGLGHLEELVVLPEYRMRGIATALVQRCAESARAKGAGLVFLPADANDTPKNMYLRMGFEPVYVFRNYVKQKASPEHPESATTAL